MFPSLLILIYKVTKITLSDKPLEKIIKDFKISIIMLS